MILVAYNTQRYRDILNGLVKEGDVVIEIGPHLGEGTKLYASKTKLTITVDKGIQAETAFIKLQKKFGNLKFVRGDVRDFDTVKKVLNLTNKCDVLAADMGGGRFPDTVFKVWAVWSGVFKPKNSVIRNRGIGEFLQRARVDDESIKIKFPDDGWLSKWGRAIPYKLKKQMEEFEFWVEI